MSTALAPLVWTLAAVLGVAGLAKLRSPEPARRALAGAGFATGAGGVRLVAACECAIGAWCLAAPGSAATAGLAAAYLAFAAAVARMRQAGVADCGCFGEGSFEPARAHLALNLAAAGVAALAIVVPPPAVGAAVERPPLEAAAVVTGVACCVLLAYAVFTIVPRAWGAYGGEEAAR